MAGAILCAFCAQNKQTRPDLHQTLCYLFTQGAVAVEGEAHLWRPGRGGPPLPTSAGHTGHSASDAATQLAAEGQMELDSMDAGAAGIRDEARPGAQAEGDGTGAVSAAGEHWWLPLQAGQALACWLPQRVGLLRLPAADSCLGDLWSKAMDGWTWTAGQWELSQSGAHITAGAQLPVRVWSRDGEPGGQATSGYEPSIKVAAAECSPTTGTWLTRVPGHLPDAARLS